MKTAAMTQPNAASSESTPAAGNDRRRTPRFRCEGTGEVIVLGGALCFRGKVRDLSVTGCYLTTDVLFTLERGTQVEVALVVNRVHFRVAAGVRASHKVKGVGLEFMNVSPRCAAYIRDLVLELEAKENRARNKGPAG
jgi:hypothetical protein